MPCRHKTINYFGCRKKTLDRCAARRQARRTLISVIPALVPDRKSVWDLAVGSPLGYELIHQGDEARVMCGFVRKVALALPNLPSCCEYRRYAIFTIC